jgi:MFS family permease
MTADAVAPETDLPPSEVTPLPARQRLFLLTASSVPILLFSLATPYQGLIALPMLFFLKNRLHLDASGTARFAFLLCIPLFMSFVFGFIRDRWSPWRRGDQSYLVVFGFAAAAAYAVMAFSPPTYGVLLGGGLVVTTLMQFVNSAANGLSTSIARRHAMAGQMSTAMNVALSLPLLIGFAVGGVISAAVEANSDQAAARLVFLIGAALLAAIGLFGVFGPRRLFADAPPEPSSLTPLADIGRLLRTWAIYPALLIQLLWQFGPGVGIAMQYHLANDLKANDAQVGLWFSVFYGSFIPIYLLYGWLAQRFPLKVLVWVGAITAVGQMAPLLFAHTPGQAIWAAAALGVLGGIGQPAFIDLCIRSAPKGLEGSMMMLVWTMYWIAVRGGDLWGADLYDHHGGYNTALVATIAVYALILPIIPIIPRRILAGQDA